MKKNKISTPSYFIKRLKDNGYYVWRMFDKYGPHDPRRWTVLIDPGGFSVWITCYTNKMEQDDVLFELHDGGIRIPKNLHIKTQSIEPVISYLIKFGVENKQIFDSSLGRLNNSDEQQRDTRTSGRKRSIHPGEEAEKAEDSSYSGTPA